MSNIKYFLHPVVENETKDVIISKRFKDDDGNLVPFKIKVLSQAENEKLRVRASKPIKRNGVIVGQDFDSIKYGNMLVIASVVEPNFADAELCKAYNTLDPEEVPGKMLTAGEFNKLVRAINDLNGFSEDTEEVLEAEAKN